MMDRLERITDSYNQGCFDREGYQEWDRDMTTIMTESAKKFETESSIWWSPDLHFAHLGVNTGD